MLMWGLAGGVWGLERGYCMMIGGPDAAVEYLDPSSRLSLPGLRYCADSGA